MKTFEKTSSEVLDYTRKWERWLKGDTIFTSAWEAETTTVTIDSDSNDTNSATVWLSGGTDGSVSRITNTIVTVAGRTATRSFDIKIVEERG